MKKWSDPELDLSQALKKLGAEPYFHRYTQGGASPCWLVKGKYDDGNDWKLFIFLSRPRNLVVDLQFFDNSLNPSRSTDKALYLRSRNTFKKIWERLERFMIDEMKESREGEQDEERNENT